ncbi:MAG: hypothetical protein AAGF15_07170 [Pseudomonadota bacterium]
MLKPFATALLLGFATVSLPATATAQTAPDAETADPFAFETVRTAPMTVQTLDEIIRVVDPEAKRSENTWTLTVEEIGVQVVADERFDRMRIMVPITTQDELRGVDLVRMMQANFDSALDARYAFARGILWSTYIHPLSPLTDKQFLSGIGQTVNLLRTFGKQYTSGVIQFGGGDSRAIEEKKLIDELLKLERPV